jgi:LysM repeat protein/ABC-type branched-subunit amino acid transport system substrate-binding protein
MGIGKMRILISILILCFVQATSLLAQDGIKKSTKTVLVDGRKFYVHKVEKGQTLYAIAKAYNVTVNDIVVENPDALNGIKPGQELRIAIDKPVVKKTPVTSMDTGNYFIHKVEAGQTMYSITKKYNVTEQQILALNPEAKNGLKASMDLKIPGKIPVNIAQIPNVIPDTVAVKADRDTVAILKSEYYVALMLPLQLYSLDQINVDDIKKGEQTMNPKQEAAIQFYEGALLAVDSMRKAGMKVELYVYDIDENDSAKVMKLMKGVEFDKIDLIIGPLSPNIFTPVAALAAEKNIGIISPVSPVNKVLFKQPNAIKMFPSTTTQMEVMADYVAQEHKNDNVILITNSSPKDLPAIAAFKQHYNSVSGRDSVITVRGTSGLDAKLQRGKKNIIIVPSGQQAFVSDMLRALYSLTEHHDIIVYGMPTWMNYDNIDMDYLDSLHVRFASPYYVDYSASHPKSVIGKYAANFSGDPGSYVYCGYDATLYGLSQLKKGGRNFFKKADSLPVYNGTQQQVKLIKPESQSGFENNGVFILGVVDFTLVKLK